MPEIKINPILNVHQNYNRVNLVNPYRYGEAAPETPNYLLDTYPGAVMAYSFRHLRFGYGGACVRIARVSDGVEHDIFFNNGYIDIPSIESFLGTSDGDIIKWYDQAGTNDLYVELTGNNPNIKRLGTLNTFNGKIYLNSQSSRYRLIAPVSFSQVNAFHVIQESVNTLVAIGNGHSNSHYYGLIQSGGTSTALQGSATNVSYYINNNLFTGTTRGQLYTAVNTGNIVSFTADLDLSTFTFFKMGYENAESIKHVHKTFELLFYPTVNKTDVNTNIMNYYGI